MEEEDAEAADGAELCVGSSLTGECGRFFGLIHLNAETKPNEGVRFLGALIRKPRNDNELGMS